MAITPLTGFKSFTFGDVVSTDYGVQILGEGVFNAPERVVEMIEIPGRNGTFALDKGRFENIEVTYPATLIADNVTDFAEAVSDLRNALCSKRGYMRLEDDYHPDEYRMAVYKEGLEVDEEVLRVGKFNIKFDCKPQRFLTSGETAVSVDSGDTLTNPTPFEASPLLLVEGYGTLNVNGVEIEIDDELVGDVTVSQTSMKTLPFDVTFSDVYIAPGDVIELSQPFFYIFFDATNTQDAITGAAVTSWGGYAASAPEAFHGTDYARFIPKFIDPTTFNYGTPATRKVTFTAQITQAGTVSSQHIEVSLNYDGNKTITFDTTAKNLPGYTVRVTGYVGYNNLFVIHSTATTFGHPTYIDCDLGEAYADDDGVISSLNSYIALGSKLPILSVGESEITFDNTINDLKVVPRWWKI